MDVKQVGRFFDENINDEKTHVVMESSSVWYNIYSYLSEEKHLNVVLSNPIKTRAIASATWMLRNWLAGSKKAVIYSSNHA